MGIIKETYKTRKQPLHLLLRTPLHVINRFFNIYTNHTNKNQCNPLDNLETKLSTSVF